MEERLAKLSELRHDPESPAIQRELRKALAAKNRHVVGKAARLVRELGLSELVPDLVAGFERFLPDSPAKDKGCVAKIGIVEALVALEAAADEVFLRGMRLVQKEPSWGEPVDAAAELRAHSALGLVNSGHRQAVLELVGLLVDPERVVRLAAAQGVGASGRLEAEAVLRLKALMGDDDPEVITPPLHLRHRQARGLGRRSGSQGRGGPCQRRSRPALFHLDLDPLGRPLGPFWPHCSPDSLNWMQE